MPSRRRLPRFAAVLACVATLTLSACSGGSGSGSGGKYQFGNATTIGTVIPKADRKPAPDLSAKLLNGDGSTSLAQYKNKVVVLAFWASWCPPCRVEMPQLDGLSHELAGKGVSFLGVDTRDADGPALAFLKDYKVDFPSVVDPNGQLSQKMGNIPSGLPFTIVIDKTGKVAAAYLARYGAKDLSRALTTLRAEA